MLGLGLRKRSGGVVGGVCVCRGDVGLFSLFRNPPPLPASAPPAQ